MSAGKPLFCVKARDENKSNLVIYMNFLACNTVEYPEPDIRNDVMTKALAWRQNPSRDSNYPVPVRLSPVFWAKGEPTVHTSDYVINIVINDRFSKRVLRKENVQIYVVLATMGIIDRVYRNGSCGDQDLGHPLLLDQGDWAVLKDRKAIEYSELVRKATN